MVVMQIQSRLKCFYKKISCYQFKRRRFAFVIPFIFLSIYACLSLSSAFASSYPTINKLPENPNSNNDYTYNSFEEFKRQVTYGSNESDLENQNFSLSSDMMGVSGPLSFNFTWSDTYGFIFNAQYVSMINAKNAYNIETDLGFKMNRINLTLGHAFSPKNRLKMTVERLAQKQTFDFDSGSIDQWVSQYAGGAAFQHILGGGFFNNITVGGYYAQALSQSLDPVVYFIGDEAWVNYRHIAGATSRGVNTSIGIRPWKTGTITLTGYYDWVHYRNLYDNVSADDSQELGYGISLSQYISSSIQTTASYVERAVYRSIEVGVSFYHNVFHDKRAIALSISAARSSSDNVAHENSVTVGLNYYFAPMNNTYHIPGFQMQSLKNWTSSPAVKMEQVLAAADQMSEKAEVTADVTDVFNFAQLTDNGTIGEQISWHDITTNVPNPQLDYYLTLDKADTLLGSTERLLDNEPIHGNTYTAQNLDANTTYNVTLVAKEETTHVSHPYYGSFKTGADTINWPNGFDPTLKVIKFNDNDTLNATLTFDIAESSIGSTMTYHAELVLTTNPDNILWQKDGLTNKNVEDGITIDQPLLLNTPYTVRVTPTDAAHTVGQTKHKDIITPDHDVITWPKDLSPQFNTTQYNPDGTINGKLTFNNAVSSIGSAMSYKVTVNNTSIKDQTYTQAQVNAGIELDNLTGSATFNLEVTPIDEAGTQGDTKDGSIQTPAKDTVTWPETFTPTWTTTGYNADGTVNGTLTFNDAISSTGSAMSYIVTVDGTSITKKTYTADEVKEGIPLNNLTAETNYQVDVTPEDAIGTTGDEGQGSIKTPQKDIITWPSDGLAPNWATTKYNSDGTLNGKLTFNSATSNTGSTMSYKVTVEGTSIVNKEYTQAEVDDGIEIDNLAGTTSYKVDVTPEDAIGTTGDPVSGSITTPQQDIITWPTGFSASLSDFSYSNGVTAVLKFSSAVSSTDSAMSYTVTVDGTSIDQKVYTQDQVNAGISVTGLDFDQSYTVTVTPEDAVQTVGDTQKNTVTVPALQWKEWNDSSIVINYKGNGTYAYTFSVPEPDATTTPDVGTIKYQYRYKTDYTDWNSWTDWPDPTKIITISSVPPGAGVTVQVKAYVEGYHDTMWKTVENYKRN
jgi:hypothetical protein